MTGGGGFLGSRIVRLLLERGYAVRSLGRSAQPQNEALGVTVIRADLSDPAQVLAAAKGCAAVFHVAAKAGIWGRYADFFSANVTGTRNVIAACRAAGVPILIHTSTPSVVFSGEPFEGADESLPLQPGNRLSHYAATKAQAEADVLAAHNPASGGLRVCALRPHLIYGPGDPHLLPRLRQRAASGRLRQVGDGTNRVDLTHVDNAAQAHLLAFDALQKADAAAGGRAYFLSDGQPVKLWPWINAYLHRQSLTPPTRRISAARAYRIGAAAEWLWRTLPLRGEPPMTRFVAVELSKSHWFDISAARADLGYAPVPHPF